MLGAGRDQLLNLILSNGLANRSFMAYNFPGYVQVHSTKVINGKKIEEIVKTYLYYRCCCETSPVQKEIDICTKGSE